MSTEKGWVPDAATLAWDLNYLRTVSSKLPQVYSRLGSFVLNDERFLTAPGSSGYHHAYRGGLLQHTTEVVMNVELLVGNQPSIPYLNELSLAAIWHDFHKIYEYKIESIWEDGRSVDKIHKLDYRNRIGHVAGSYSEFYHQARLSDMDIDDILRVGHIMLAHHGRLEWRSPVEPQTPEAFILHSADMLSARPS